MCCIGCGAHKDKCRATGAICAAILFLFNFAMIVTTAVYRFSAIGKLCALDVTSTNVPSSDFFDTDDTWTYEKDGNMLTAIWIFHVMGFGLCLMAGCAPMYSSDASANKTKEAKIVIMTTPSHHSPM